MNIAPGIIGIDISKQHLDVFDGGRVIRWPNTPTAIAALIASWRDKPRRVLFEATGSYDLALRQALEAAGIGFARVNPARARDFARAAGFLAKTDAVDAKMLAAMAQCLDPPPSAASEPERQRLALLHKRRDQLVAARQQERTRRHDAPPEIAADIARHIAWLSTEIAALQQRIARLLAAAEKLNQAACLLRSAPGVGPVTATTLIALLPELGQRSPQTIAALAGLAPLTTESGQFRGKSQIHGGRKRVRNALYMAAVAAIRTRSRFANTYQALRARVNPPNSPLSPSPESSSPPSTPCSETTVPSNPKNTVAGFGLSGRPGMTRRAIVGWRPQTVTMPS
jgi:transposase